MLGVFYHNKNMPRKKIHKFTKNACFEIWDDVQLILRCNLWVPIDSFLKYGLIRTEKMWNYTPTMCQLLF